MTRTRSIAARTWSLLPIVLAATATASCRRSTETGGAAAVDEATPTRGTTSPPSPHRSPATRGSATDSAVAAPTPAPAAQSTDVGVAAGSLAPTAAPRPLVGTARVTLAEGTVPQLQALERANLAADAGDLAAAFGAYREAAEGPLTGTSVSARLALADLLAAREELAEATRIYAELEANAPAVPEVRFAAGRFHAAQSRVAAAIESFEAARRLEPDLLPVYPLLGTLLSQTGQPEAAAALFTDYEQRLQRLVAGLRDRATPTARRLSIIELFSMIGDDRAGHALRGAVRDPDVEVRVAAAAALVDDGEPESLVALAEAALAERDPFARQAMAAALARAQRRATTKAEP